MRGKLNKCNRKRVQFRRSYWCHARLWTCGILVNNETLGFGVKYRIRQTGNRKTSLSDANLIGRPDQFVRMAIRKSRSWAACASKQVDSTRQVERIGLREKGGKESFWNFYLPCKRTRRELNLLAQEEGEKTGREWLWAFSFGMFVSRCVFGH